VGFRQSTKDMIQMCLSFYFTVCISASGGEGKFISVIILPAIKIIKLRCPTTASKSIFELPPQGRLQDNSII